MPRWHGLLQRVVHPDLAKQGDGQALIQQVNQHGVAGSLGILLGPQTGSIGLAAQL